MRSRTVSLAVISLSAAGILYLTCPSLAGTWVNDFEDPAQADIWKDDNEGPRTGVSEWFIEDGWLHQDPPEMAESYFKAAGGGPDWTDLTVEYDLIMVEGPRAVAGVLLRADETASRGFRVVLHDANGLTICPWAENAWQDPSVSFPTVVEQGREYHMKCSLVDQILSVWVDDNQLVEDYDIQSEFEFESGMLGLICYGCHVMYDNIVVTGPGVEPLSVEVPGKLPTTWGSIRRDRQN
jgi:hypothetical protein